MWKLILLLELLFKAFPSDNCFTSLTILTFFWGIVRILKSLLFSWLLFPQLWIKVCAIVAILWFVYFSNHIIWVRDEWLAADWASSHEFIFRPDMKNAVWDFFTCWSMKFFNKIFYFSLYIFIILFCV